MFLIAVLCALVAALLVELCELPLVLLPDVALPVDVDAVPVELCVPELSVDVTVPVVVTVPDVPDVPVVVIVVTAVALVAEESAEEVTVTVLSVLSVVPAVVEAEPDAEETEPEVEALLGTALTGERISNWGVKFTAPGLESEVIWMV